MLCVDEGIYDSYRLEGFFLVQQDFEPMTELAKYLETNPDQRTSYSFKSDEFFAQLLEKGLLVKVEYGRLFLGSYSGIDLYFEQVALELTR